MEDTGLYVGKRSEVPYVAADPSISGSGYLFCQAGSGLDDLRTRLQQADYIDVGV